MAFGQPAALVDALVAGAHPALLRVYRGALVFRAGGGADPFEALVHVSSNTICIVGFLNVISDHAAHH